MSEENLETTNETSDVSSTILERINDFKNRLNIDDSQSFMTYVYKVTENTSGPKSFAVCGKFENEIVDDHEIGMRFGSGKYKIVITFNDPKNKKRPSTTLFLNVDRCYDDMRKSQAVEQARAVVPVSNQSASFQEGMNFMLSAFERLQAVNKVAPVQSSVDPSDALQKMFSFTAQMMQENLSAMNKMMISTRKNIQLIESEDEPEENQNPVQAVDSNNIAALIEKIFPVVFPLIQPLLPDNLKGLDVKSLIAMFNATQK